MEASLFIIFTIGNEYLAEKQLMTMRVIIFNSIRVRGMMIVRVKVRVGVRVNSNSEG
jgi:hypothetical protein